MYESGMSSKVLLQYHARKLALKQKLLKLECMIKFAHLIDILFIKAILLRKTLIKRIFVLELEHGQEVYIPDELSCEVYPFSARFYDPIIQISNQIFSHK